MRMEKRRGRVIMSRVCGDKQSVAEQASAHRIHVRDLAAISISHVRVFRTQRTKCGRDEHIAKSAPDLSCNSGWDHRFFGIPR